MNKTVFITGASSGIGKATAQYFLDKGWNVAATARRVETLEDLDTSEQSLCTRCDVTDVESIRSALEATQSQFGSIDVVVNNAGYGAVGPFEASTQTDVEKQFNVNVYGLMSVMRETLPYMRSQKNGVIINISSVGGRMTFPLYSVYHSTKWAVEGLTESMMYELEGTGVRMKLIEPGAIKTDFYGRSMAFMKKDGLTAYDTFIEKAMGNMNHAGQNGSSPEDVAAIIYRAATDGKKKLRYPAAGNARGILWLRRLLPEHVFYTIVRKVVTRKRG